MKSAALLPILAVHSLGIVRESKWPINLPVADCGNCLYGTPEWKDDSGHCYMFRDPPIDGRCGKMTPVKKEPNNA